MMSTVAWAEARKLAGSMSFKPTSCCSSSAGALVGPFADAWVVSEAMVRVPQCGSDRDRRPIIPSECKPERPERPRSEDGRGGAIRTLGLLNPIQVRYQAAPRPDADRIPDGAIITASPRVRGAKDSAGRPGGNRGA